MKYQNEVFPAPVGHLIIGEYNHRKPFPDNLLLDTSRQPFIILEWIDGEWIIKAAQPTKQLAMKYMKQGRYLIHPAKWVI